MKAMAEQWPQPGSRGVDQSPNGDWYFKHVSGHCVFLRDDNLCAIHHLYGESAKPWFCREYPFHAVREPRGFSVRVREDCGGFYKSFRTGQPIELQAEQVVSLPRRVPYQTILDRTIVIAPGLGVSAENWTTVEPMILDLIDASSSLPNAIIAIRDSISQINGRQISVPCSHDAAYSFVDDFEKISISI